MKQNSPFISVILPTRDRPDFVKYSLEYLSKQTFKNFEVILVDNFIQASCAKEYEPYCSDERFRYFKPPEPLPMADNWEFALTKATGRYITVISEKYLFRQDAFEFLFNELSTEKADLVTWWNETFTVDNFSSTFVSGTYVPQYKAKAIKAYDPIEELSRRFSFAQPPYSRSLGMKECLGKIYSGCFHSRLIDKIKCEYGRVFQPTMPDITSMTAALSLTPRCLDLGQPLMMVCASASISNGFQTISNSQNFKRFYADYDVKKYQVSALPYEKIHFSLNNYIAYDFQYFQKRSTNDKFKALKVHRLNLLVRIKEDLDRINVWESDEERDQQYQNWQSYVDCLTAKDRQYIESELLNLSYNEPSNDEIHFAGGEDIGVYQHRLSAVQRAHMNWRDNKVFRIKDEYRYFDSVKNVMEYFLEYYQESAKLLRLTSAKNEGGKQL